LSEEKNLNELTLIENKNKIYLLFILSIKIINKKKQINNYLKQENSFDILLNKRVKIRMFA
jgi:hypothetical protein